METAFRYGWPGMLLLGGILAAAALLGLRRRLRPLAIGLALAALTGCVFLQLAAPTGAARPAALGAGVDVSATQGCRHAHHSPTHSPRRSPRPWASGQTGAVRRPHLPGRACGPGSRHGRHGNPVLEHARPGTIRVYGTPPTPTAKPS